MARWVPELSGSTYEWEPALGGFRKANRESPNVSLRHPSFRAYADYMETEAFSRALGVLLHRSKTARVAIMCSESLWWRCHRRLIADAAVLLHGADARHLMHDGMLRPHIPTAGVRVTVNGSLRYDLLVEPESVT